MDQVDRLHDHHFAAEHQVRLDALDEMAELLNGWESERSAVEGLTEVGEWARWYAQAGSLLDLTAVRLMVCQHGGTGLGAEIARLLEGYWEWRDGLNAAFANEFLAHYEAAVHNRDSGIFGVHRILDWVATSLLQHERRVLLVVVDGLGWPGFWHLVDQWREQVPPTYVREPRCALSLVPSVTSVSRKGLFLGALPTDRLDDEETYDQKARVSERKALEQAYRGRRVKLYNKTNLHGTQVLHDIQFHGADLIAVIVNAVDEDLKTAATTPRLPRLDDLAPLASLTRVGLDAGWEVLITADHGHTWHRDKALRQGDILPGGGERFAPMELGQAAPPGAIVTREPNIIRVQGSDSIALLTATGAYYGRIPRRGYHGGASLEEVVVPRVFLTRRETSFRTKSRVPSDQSGHEDAITVNADHLARVVLMLPEGQTMCLDLPFTPSPQEVRLLHALARHDEVSEAALKKVLGTRRVSGVLAGLRERLAAEGLDYVEETGLGPEGATYRFRAEMLPQ